MGMLNGGIRAIMGAAFSPLYLSGTLTRSTLTPDGVGGGSVAQSSQSCKVQIDSCTEAMRQQAGYASTDVRLLILQSGVSGGLDTDCEVTVSDRTYQVASVTQDPAASYWECRGAVLA